MNLGPTELIIILVIVLLIFGSTKLPKLARSMGEASQEFRKGVSEGGKDEPTTGSAGAPDAPRETSGGTDAPAAP